MHRINFRNSKIGLKRAVIKCLWVLHLWAAVTTKNTWKYIPLYRNALIGVPKVVFAIKAPTRANCRKPTLRWAILRNAILFVCTLYHSTLPWVISSNVTPFGMCTVLFDIALSHFRMTQRYTVCVYTVPQDITLRHLTQRYTVCVLYCKWVLSYSQLS